MFIILRTLGGIFLGQESENRFLKIVEPWRWMGLGDIQQKRCLMPPHEWEEEEEEEEGFDYKEG